jgi:hypothetical protein
MGAKTTRLVRLEQTAQLNSMIRQKKKASTKFKSPVLRRIRLEMCIKEPSKKFTTSTGG